MRHVRQFHVSRFVSTGEDEDRPFTVFFSRLAVLGTRFVAGRVGLPPHRLALEMPRRFRTATREASEQRAEALNATDVRGGDPESFGQALAS